MKDWRNVRISHCREYIDKDKKCDLPPSAHGIEKGRGAIVSHPFVM